VPLFAPYLKLDQKMRYFWPIAAHYRGLVELGLKAKGK